MPSFKIWKEFKKTISLLMVLMMLIPMFSIQSLAIGGGSTSTKRVTTYVYEEAQPLELEKKRLNITGLAEEIGSIKIISPESNVSNRKTTAYYNEKITFEAEIMDKDNKVIEGITEGVTWEYKSSESSMVSGDPIKITEDGGTSIEITPSELDLTFKNTWNISYLHMTASYGGKESTVTVSINASKGLITDKETVELGKDITAILETAIYSVGNKAKIILKKDGEAVAEIEEQEVIIKAYGESGKAEANFTIPEDLQTGIYTLEALPVGAPPLVLGRVDFEVTKEKTEPAELTNIIIWEPTGYILRPSIDPNNPYATFYKFFDTSEKARDYEFIVDERVDKVGIGCSINQQPADTRVTYRVNGVDKGEAITGTKGGRVNYETVELSIGKTTIEYIVNEGQVDEGIYTFVIDRKKTAMLDSLEITNLKEYPEWHSLKKYKFDKLKWNYFPDAINEEVEMIVSAQERYSVTYAVYDGINKENWWLESQGEVKGPLKVSLEKDPTKRKTVFFYVTSDEEDTLPSTYEVRIETSPFYLPLDDIKVENIEGDFAYLEEDIEKAKYGWGNVPGKSYTLKAKDNTKPVKIIPFLGDHGKISYYIGDNIENTKTTSESGQEIIIDKFNSDGKQSLTIKTIPEEGDYWHREYTYYFQLEQANSIAKELLNISIDGANNFNFNPELREYNIITHEKVNMVIDSEEGDRVYYSIDEGTEEEILGGEISLTMDLGQSKKLTLRVVPSEDNSTYVEGTYVLNFIRQSEDKETKDIDKLLTPILLYYFADDYNYFEWSLMSMASLGYKEKIDKDRYINGQAAGVATTTRQTDFAKAAINLMALGYSAEDLTTFSAKNKTVNLVEESVRVSKDIVDATDINATFNTNVFPILWASSNKEYRDKFNEIAVNKGMANIDDLVQATINSQRADGSFPVIGDIDGIAMVLQGLAPYYNSDEIYDPVTIAVNRGLNYLSERQDKDRGTFDLGGKGDSNNISSESISMVTVALSALGIDANSDSRFLTRDGKGLIDVLEENFITDEGLFCHIIEKDGSKKSNGMASEQGFRALASYKGFLVKGGAFNIYNADDHIKEPCVVFPDDTLGQTIAYVKGLKEDDYEGESWAELQEVLNKAITIYNDPDATHEEINSIVQELIATYQRLTPKRDFGGYITLTVEKFTLGQGYIKEPIKLPFNEGDNVAKLITNFLGEGKYQYSGNINSGFYLSSVYDNDTREANIPRYILDKAGEITSRTSPEWLGEFDYTSEAGWMYTVNNELLSIGMSEYTVKDGDVIRVQFSVHGLGADLGGGFSESYIKPANKDKLTAKIAEINSNTDKDKLLSKEIVKTAYNKALETLKDMEHSQENVDKALQDLKSAIEGIVEPEEPETPTTYTITFELSPKDAKLVVKDREGKEIKSEKDKTYQLKSGDYSYTASITGYKTKIDSFTVKDIAKTIKVDLVKTSSGGGSTGGGGSSGGGGTSKAQDKDKVKYDKSTTVKDKEVTIEIPANAMEKDFKVNISKVSNISKLPIAPDKEIVGNVFEITKDKDGNFKKTVTITLPYNKTKVDFDKQDISLYWLNEKTDKWIELDNVKVNKSAETVTGEIDHFTKFAVLATQKATEDIKVEDTQKPEEVEKLKEATSPTDIKDHWAEKHINRLITTGAISGYPDGTFKPDNNITRAEFATILVKALDLEEKTSKDFTDTKNQWARKYISTAQAHGIISGYDETIFGPDDLITREQMAVMIVKAKKLEKAKKAETFIDSSSISSWAKTAVELASGNDIMKGYPEGDFKPQNKATRAEAVTVIVKIL